MQVAEQHHSKTPIVAKTLCNTPILSLWLSPYIVIIIIELGYNMRVHSKMGVDNFVVLQIGKKIKVLVHTIWCGN